MDLKVTVKNVAGQHGNRKFPVLVATAGTHTITLQPRVMNYGADGEPEAELSEAMVHEIADRLREYELLRRKVAHGCTDASCSLCDHD